MNEEGAGFDVNVEPEKGTDGKYRVSIVFYSDTFTYPYDTILLFDNVRYAPQREMGIYRDLGEPSISYSNEFSVYGENPDEVNEKLNESYISYGQYISFIKTNVSFSSQDVRIGFLK